ncbi:MAG: protein phosphatase 2C domain-containing protein [Deferribacteraceae bacterium]|jgi:serine/threonine protein phosphatase PrpC|nr:protein phosphatase 2C domain-containing protein [Deferribacteraceae bacterium]
MQTELSEFNFRYSAGADIGAKRKSNQDEVICCPEYGFFAVSDGMGGLCGGGETSKMISKVLPSLIMEAHRNLQKDPNPEYSAELLISQILRLSDHIYKNLNQDPNSGEDFAYGATLCGVWLVGNSAVFINLGDSRGYILPFRKRHIRRITDDHNMAAVFVAAGELTKEEARVHPSSSSITRFVGMASPALPETFIEKVDIGDRIILCSDGLYGMVEDEFLPRLMRTGRSSSKAVKRLIDEANLAGGRDNISLVYIKIEQK